MPKGRSVNSGETLTRDDKLAACVRHILNTEGVPPFNDHANQVITRTLDPDGSTRQLTRIVLKDLGITSQVLRVANSALYNRSGRPILSVAHGITLLGWETVRQLVSAVRYIEHFSERSPGLRELMVLSVLSAVHGREVSAAVGYPRPEEAYICTLFRDLGEVLVACHYPHEYSRIIVTMHQERISGRAACVRVLDFPWNEAGQQVAEAWNMPGKVRLCLGEPDAGVTPEDRCLVSIASYGQSLTHALYRDGAPFEAVHLSPVLDLHGHRSLISVRDLRRIVDTSIEETRQTLATLHIPTDMLRLDRQAARARFVLESVPVFDKDALQALDAAIEQAGRTVRASSFQLSPFIVKLLDAVRAAGFDRVVFGLVNESRSAIRGRLASAANIEGLLERFEFSMAPPDGPILAMHHKHDVLVDRARDDRYDTSSLVQALEPSAFALLPIVAGRAVVGCLYADRMGPAPGLDSIRGPLSRVRQVIAQAVRKRSPAESSE